MPREVKLAIETSRLRSILGLTEDQLPDDASDEQINEVLATTPGATSNPDAPAAPQPEDPNRPEDEPTDVEKASKNTPTQPTRTAGGGLLVDEAMWAETQKELAVVRREREERETKADQEFLTVAVRKGKFPAARVDHYMTLMKADREGTRQFIEKLPEGLPVEEFGNLGDLDDALKASDYPEAWLSPAERRRIKVAAKAYAEGNIGDVEPGTIVREA